MTKLLSKVCMLFYSPLSIVQIVVALSSQAGSAISLDVTILMGVWEYLHIDFTCLVCLTCLYSFVVGVCTKSFYCCCSKLGYVPHPIVFLFFFYLFFSFMCIGSLLLCMSA